MQELVCLMEVMVINAADTRIIARAFYVDDGDSFYIILSLF